MENPVQIFCHNFAHKIEFGKTTSIISNHFSIKMTNHFYFCFISNDEASHAAGAMLALDYNLATHDEISEIFYGYRRHDGGFTIEGFAFFGVDVDDDEVHHLLLGFEVWRYSFSLDAYTMIQRVTAISLFTKHGTSWDYGHVQFRPQNLFDYFNHNA